jgi:hypothetical protein
VLVLCTVFRNFETAVILVRASINFFLLIIMMAILGMVGCCAAFSFTQTFTHAPEVRKNWFDSKYRKKNTIKVFTIQLEVCIIS